MRRPVLVLFVFALLSAGCGPAFRFRGPETMPRDVIEFGVGGGAGVRAEDGSYGGAELQAFVRGGVESRVELGGRIWTASFNSVGGAFDVRLQLVRGPFDLTLDFAVLGGACCGIGGKNRTLAAAIGFDGGLSFGRRFGTRGPAFYIAPHVQQSWTLPLQQGWPVQLFIPVGLDIPLGPVPISLRPEVVGVALFYADGPTRWRVGAGMAVAFRGIDKARIQARDRAAKRQRERVRRIRERREEQARRREARKERAPGDADERPPGDGADPPPEDADEAARGDAEDTPPGTTPEPSEH